ncbi:MAG: DUF2807 domain-containing protein [Bacteroidetes bacterium]|nr:DUF2807 domain-containing protein [Bacteroidota bacterium]MBL6943998.1 DUF2807 domain-containing protein [Bacteroidales bacterium]
MKKNLLLIILLLTFLPSCKKGGVSDCFYSSGKLTMQERNIDDFNTILLKDNVNLILNKSENNGIVVEAGSNLVGGIKTEVNQNGVLEIRNDNQCNWIRSFESPINIHLNYVDFDTVEYRSIGDITNTDTLKTDSLWINVHEGAGKIDLKLDVLKLYASLHYGTASIVLSGTCGLSYVYSASFGLIDMINLESNFIYVNNRSSNDIYLRVVTNLGATIENVGNIYYAGNPPIVTLNKIGSGELIKMD